MAKNSNISWTHATFNPWWGCEKISPGCKNCYAATFAKRTGNDCWGSSPRRLFGDKHWAEPLAWNTAAVAAGERRRVFCASMADVFEGLPEMDVHLLRLLDLIQDTPQLDWLLLTKRPEKIKPIMERVSNGTFGDIWNFADHMPNVWLGTTVENQDYADIRIPQLLEIPAAVRFLSVEPMLGPVDLRFTNGLVHGEDAADYLLEWIICGGESGAERRPFQIEWAEDLARQCHAASVPFFMKQDSHQKPGQQGRLPDALYHTKQFPKP